MLFAWLDAGLKRLTRCRIPSGMPLRQPLSNSGGHSTQRRRARIVNFPLAPGPWRGSMPPLHGRNENCRARRAKNGTESSRLHFKRLQSFLETRRPARRGETSSGGSKRWMIFGSALPTFSGPKMLKNGPKRPGIASKRHS